MVVNRTAHLSCHMYLLRKVQNEGQKRVPTHFDRCLYIVILYTHADDMSHNIQVAHVVGIDVCQL